MPTAHTSTHTQKRAELFDACSKRVVPEVAPLALHTSSERAPRIKSQQANMDTCATQPGSHPFRPPQYSFSKSGCTCHATRGVMLTARVLCAQWPHASHGGGGGDGDGGRRRRALTKRQGTMRNAEMKVVRSTSSRLCGAAAINAMARLARTYLQACVEHNQRRNTPAWLLPLNLPRCRHLTHGGSGGGGGQRQRTAAAAHPAIQHAAVMAAVSMKGFGFIGRISPIWPKSSRGTSGSPRLYCGRVSERCRGGRRAISRGGEKTSGGWTGGDGTGCGVYWRVACWRVVAAWREARWRWRARSGKERATRR